MSNILDTILVPDYFSSISTAHKLRKLCLNNRLRADVASKNASHLQEFFGSLKSGNYSLIIIEIDVKRNSAFYFSILFVPLFLISKISIGLISKKELHLF